MEVVVGGTVTEGGCAFVVDAIEILSSELGWKCSEGTLRAGEV